MTKTAILHYSVPPIGGGVESAIGHAVLSHGVALAVILCHVGGIPPSEVYEHIPENAKPRRAELGIAQN